MLAALVVSMVAVYPLTPLYPKYEGKPMLEDNDVITIYCVSGVEFLGSFYDVNSGQSVITTHSIVSDMYSLYYPKFINSHIDNSLGDIGSLAELRNRIVVFDVEQSGIQTLRMRTLVLPLLSVGLGGTLGVVYSNGFFYVGMAPCYLC
jgi:hypothetical protein